MQGAAMDRECKIAVPRLENCTFLTPRVKMKKANIYANFAAEISKGFSNVKEILFSWLLKGAESPPKMAELQLTPPPNSLIR